MALGWCTPLGAYQDPVGTQVSSDAELLQLPSTTRELERQQAAEMAVLCRRLCFLGDFMVGRIYT